MNYVNRRSKVQAKKLSALLVEIVIIHALHYMSSKFLRSLLVLLFIGTSTTISYSTNLRDVANQSNQIDTTVYSMVQIPPAFPGGNDAMFQFIQSASQYPVNLKKGTMVILLRLLIEKDGSISNIQVTYTNVTDQLIQEAVRIVKLMPKWTPGSQDGRPLRAYFSVLIRFVNAKKL